MKKSRDIKRIIENEPDPLNGRLGITRPSGTHCPMKWQVVMAQILALPVAPWDCPATASGEIG